MYINAKMLIPDPEPSDIVLPHLRNKQRKNFNGSVFNIFTNSLAKNAFDFLLETRVSLKDKKSGLKGTMGIDEEKNKYLAVDDND